MVRLTLYSRPGCHLCDGMKETVARVTRTLPVELTEIDISADAELERLYGLEIPVLLADGKKVAKYRISPEDLRRIVGDRARPK